MPGDWCQEGGGRGRAARVHEVVEGHPPDTAARLRPEFGSGRAASGEARGRSQRLPISGLEYLGPVRDQAGRCALVHLEHLVGGVNHPAPPRFESVTSELTCVLPHVIPAHAVHSRCMVARVLALLTPAAPTGAELHNPVVAAGGVNRRAHVELRARIVCPPRDFRMPARARRVFLQGQDRQEHAGEGVYVAIWRRAGPLRGGQGVVELPVRQAGVLATAAPEPLILLAASVWRAELAHATPPEEQLVREARDELPVGVARVQRCQHSPREQDAVALSLAHDTPSSTTRRMHHACLRTCDGLAGQSRHELEQPILARPNGGRGEHPRDRSWCWRGGCGRGRGCGRGSGRGCGRWHWRGCWRGCGRGCGRRGRCGCRCGARGWRGCWAGEACSSGCP
mmetsp:Transcript_82863/g.235055  ORF Transcript_82863/g.235055 Transcript_82863/m.235055 type:complete len:396 (+) Transcript_82863:973-2160(+)